VSTLNWGDLIKDAGEISSSYEPLPDGEYDLTVIEATAKVTATGKTMFSIKNDYRTNLQSLDQPNPMNKRSGRYLFH
jgi:hypothetical protein